MENKLENEFESNCSDFFDIRHSFLEENLNKKYKRNTNKQNEYNFIKDVEETMKKFHKIKNEQLDNCIICKKSLNIDSWKIKCNKCERCYHSICLKNKWTQTKNRCPRKACMAEHNEKKKDYTFFKDNYDENSDYNLRRINFKSC